MTDRPQLPTTYEMTRSVPDHEILLVFNSDDDATDFLEWVEGDGWEKFERWRDDK